MGWQKKFEKILEYCGKNAQEPETKQNIKKTKNEKTWTKSWQTICKM